MRVFLLFFIFFQLAFSASTKDEIAKNEKSLKSTTKIEEQISQKIDILAKDIIKGENSLQITNKKIKELEKQTDILLASSQKAHEKLSILISENQKLIRTKKELEEKIVSIIADKFSFYLVADKGYQENADSIIANEVLQKVDQILKDDFKTLSEDYKITNRSINEHNLQIKSIKKSLDNLKSKQKSLQKLRQKRENDIQSLKVKHKGYKNKLEKIIAQKKEIRKILENLKIVEEEEKEEEKTQDDSIIASKTSKNKLSVKKIGSSYHKSKVKKYSGLKTIAPLESYSVKQKFGNYIVPIYNIKSFNEAVILRSKFPDAKVRNVLNGKVIFAKETPMSGKVVIVENSLGIHTIYAHLSKIAPNITIGKRVKKGAIIGRVTRDLTFEVTQKNYHIDPLQLIR